MIELRSLAALCSAAFLFAACAGPDSFGGSRQAVEAWSRPQGFAATTAGSNTLPLLALARGNSGKLLAVYIEGDGAAWPTPYHPPRDPTPTQPTALAMAAKDPAQAVVYLGRPCQYLDAGKLDACPAKYWTSHRFAPEVIDSYRQALDSLKTRFGAERLRLVGYSGGGVIALLAAETRADIEQVVTVASPASVAEWTSWHKVSPLAGSLDPGARTGPGVVATHFVGERDAIVPLGVVADYARRRGDRLELVPGFDHECCWSRDWLLLLEKTR